MVLFLCISAFLYSISFIIPQLWFTILFFTIPLSRYNCTSGHGFLWGICALSIHTSGIVYATIRMQQTPAWLCIMLFLCIIFFFAIHTAFWFFSLKKAKLLFSPLLLPIVIPLVHTCFFWYISYSCFWPLYGCEGYPFANPLLPLLLCDSMKICIRYTGFLSSLFIFFFLITFPLFIKRKSATLIYILIVLCFLFLPLDTNKNFHSHWASEILPISMQFSYHKSSLFPFECIKTKALLSPQKTIIISPESAFYCYPLFNKISLNVLNDPGVDYILGSFFQDSQEMYNTLYHISNGIIQNMHHKQHTVMFTESLPVWFCIILHALGLCNDNFSIKKAPKHHDIWHIGGAIFEPYICSELFFHYKPLHPLESNSTIVLCCNDSWFTGWADYVSTLMVTDAQFKALLWHKDILYIGYQNALFISAQGNIAKIPQ